MKIASVSEAKNALSALLDRVKAGATILIVDRGRPVARLEPVGMLDDDRASLDQLVRDGVIRPGSRPLAKSILTTPPPSPKRGASALRALLEERREGR